ncbi:MAG: ribonuclease R [Candidatus Aminicenantes bacterium]|nr:ribonuclease R [Candidatus Aminicenantes bacterium]
MLRQIFSLLAKNKRGLTLHRIAHALGLSIADRPKLEKSLKELENRGAILKIKNRYIAHQRSSIVRGKIISVHRGFGFVRPEDDLMEDIFIPSRHFGKARLGDVVEVFYKEKTGQNRHEGRVIRILSQERHDVIGLYRERRGLGFFMPWDSPAFEEIPLRKKAGLKDGMVVKLEREALAVKEILGFPDDPGVDTRAVIERFALASRFMPESLAEAEKISQTPVAKDYEGRADYREWRTVTIDGPDAQDFDDAVSIKAGKNGHFHLGVHIADVSHYVKPGSALDLEALHRGTSVYFPDLTLPMLPEKLSNNVCSLRPKEDKLTISVLLEVDGEGRSVQAQFLPSLIRTVERMTYESVYGIFEGDKPIRKKYLHLVPDLLLMRDLARLLRARRRREGSLDFDLAEPRLIYEGSSLLGVVPAERNEAHQLIEEFMVAANEAVAAFLSERGAPMIFRVHPPPATDDLVKLKDVLALFGISLKAVGGLRSKDLQLALLQAQGTREEKFIALQVLKSLRLAAYSCENRGHYGLAKEVYTHFTSPIRRYPDLVVHRILKTVLLDKKAQAAELSSVAHHCSEQERKADDAERELIKWRIFRMLRARLGDEFKGVVTDISRAGLIVELENHFVEGILPFADLAGDYHFQRTKKLLVGKATGHVLSLGTPLTVVLASVDPFLRRMTLSLP